MKIVALLNNKGGVGRTSLVYHLGWAYTDMGRRVLMADLDPQSSLTVLCITEDRLEELWVKSDEDRKSIRGAIEPIIAGTGDIGATYIEELSPRLALVPGEFRLARFEAEFSAAWTNCLEGKAAAFRTVSSLYRVIAHAARETEAEIVLIDVGPNLGAITRAALECSERSRPRHARREKTSPSSPGASPRRFTWICDRTPSS